VSIVQIREELHDYINQADERMLNIMYAMIQADLVENDHELSDSHQQILSERLKAHQADKNSGSSWEEVKNRIKSKF